MSATLGCIPHFGFLRSSLKWCVREREGAIASGEEISQNEAGPTNDLDLIGAARTGLAMKIVGAPPSHADPVA
jgi:hypothetical protein